jgi:hypothetical protein
LLSVQVMPSVEDGAGARVQVNSTSRKARVSISKDPFEDRSYGIVFMKQLEETRHDRWYYGHLV